MARLRAAVIWIIHRLCTVAGNAFVVGLFFVVVGVTPSAWVSTQLPDWLTWVSSDIGRLVLVVFGFVMLSFGIFWPKLSTSIIEPEPDVWLQDAARRILFGDWKSAQLKTVSPENLNRISEIAAQLRQFAFDKKLKIWGKQFEHGVWREISPEYWATHQVYLVSLLHEDPAKVCTELAIQGQILDKRTDLKTSKAQVDALWR